MGKMSFISVSNCEGRILYCSYQFLAAHSSDFHVGGGERQGCVDGAGAGVPGENATRR